MIRDKRLFIASINKTPCADGLESFLSHEGDSLDYFLHHERGASALAWCLEKGADVQEALALTTSLPYLTIYAGCSFTAPLLAEVVWYLCLYEGATLTAPMLSKVVGDLYLSEGSTLTAPVLAEVVGDLCLHTGATLNAPMLKR